MRGREFGARLAGWLEVIGVEPDYQQRGRSGALLDALFDSFRRTGVSVVNTIVNWNDGDLIDYFRANGFDRGHYVNLVRDLDE
ncbi:MAG TPA: hypothetical protein VGB61_11310 [Pyrinomonadaceae bacterium]